jgi:hypothetical protein
MLNKKIRNGLNRITTSAVSINLAEEVSFQNDFLKYMDFRR